MDSVVVNIRMPTKMARNVEKEAKKLGYSNKSEYIRDAIRRMANPTVKEKVLEELMKRSIEVESNYVSHEDVVKRIRG